MNLPELLTEINQRRLILSYSPRRRVVLYAPHTYVPRSIRSAVACHNQELHRLIERSEISVCAAPQLHRSSWCYTLGRFCCDYCARLLHEVSA